MNIREAGKTGPVEEPYKPIPIKSVYYGDAEPREVELAQREPEVFLKAAGIEVADDAHIQVTTQSRPSTVLARRGKAQARAAVVIIIINGDVIIIIIS